MLKLSRDIQFAYQGIFSLLCPKREEQVPVPETGGTIDVFTISNRLDSLQVRSRQVKRADSFAKKDWYDIKAPSVFQVKNVGKTLVSRTQGTKMDSNIECFEVSLADLQGDEEHSFRKIRLRAEDVQGKNVLTNFWGMNLTTDKLRSLVRKWQTLIEQ